MLVDVFSYLSMMAYRILFPLLLLLANVYVLLRIWQILPLSLPWKAAAVVLWLLAAVCFFLGFLLGWQALPLPLGAVAYEYGNTWLIAFLYLLMAFVLLDIGRLVRLVPGDFLRGSAAGSAAVFGAVCLLLVAGGVHYRHKYRVSLQVESPKVTAPVRVVLASDLHLGYHNRRAELARWIDMINGEKPDLVLFGGDVIDKDLRPVLEWDYAAELRRLEAPVMACPGNHEYYSGLPGAAEFLQQAGIRLLRDEAVPVGELTVIGRDDRTNRSRQPLGAMLPPPGRFSIVLDHQPYRLEEAEAAGIDFQFSGHTHRGQVWPASWITDLMYEKSWGPHRRGDTRYYVSSGLGIWGAKVRIGTRSEYVVLDIVPAARRK